MAMIQRWWQPTQLDAEEWLDQGRASPEAIRQSLADLRRIQRWLGGMQGLAAHLYPRMRAVHTRPVRLLDLGAGGCTIPEAIVLWTRQVKLPVHILALDLHRTHLLWAQRTLPDYPEITWIQGDALHPPLAEGTVDLVISSLFMHHFSAETLVQVLPQWARLARRSLIMMDLIRHPAPYWFMKAAGPIFARSAITRHDAAVSIRRAYRPQELQRLAYRAGFRQARVYTHFPYRVILVIDHPEAVRP